MNLHNTLPDSYVVDGVTKRLEQLIENPALLLMFCNVVMMAQGTFETYRIESRTAAIAVESTFSTADLCRSPGLVSGPHSRR